MAINTNQALVICRHIQAGNYGSFVNALSCTYMLADQDNREKLLSAFSDLFQRIENDMLAYQAFITKA